MGGIKPKHEQVILSPDQIEPSSREGKILGCCNPGGVRRDGGATLMVRVIEGAKQPQEDWWKDHIAVPRGKTIGGEYIIEWDWLREGTDAQSTGKRSVRLIEEEGRIRPTSISHFRRADSEDGIEFTVSKKPDFFSQEDYEEFGVEDPRITEFEEPIKVEGKEYKYLMSYVANSPTYEISTGFAVTNDLEDFIRLHPERPQPIFTANNKDVVLFPKKFRNLRSGQKNYMAMTRPTGSQEEMIPSIFLSLSPNLYQWGDEDILVEGDRRGHVGAGPPPLELEEGWLFLYHQHRHTEKGKEYIGTMALLDKEDPKRMLRKQEWFMDPHLKVQTEGLVENVVFPSAMFLKDQDLYIYAGAGDRHTTVHIYDLGRVMDGMESV